MAADISKILLFSSNKLPVVLQSEAAECGHACLAMICNYYGHKVDLGTLRGRYATSLQGTTLELLVQMASKLQFACRALRLELEQIPELKMPCVLHWDLNHFVVLKSADKKGITIHDPAMGVRYIPLSEVSRHFTGVALELTPTSDFEEKEDSRKLKLSGFFRKTVGLKRALLQILLVSLLLQLFTIAAPYYSQLVIDDVVVGRDLELLKVLTIGFSMLMIMRITTSTLREYVVMHLGNMLSFQLGVSMFRHLLRLPGDYFGKRHIGDIVSRFGSLSTIQKLLTTGLIAALVDGIMMLLTLIMMFVYSPLLTFVVLAAVVFYALVRIAMYRPMRSLSEESIVAAAKQNSNFMESVRAVQGIKIFGRENDRLSLWQNYFADTINVGIRLKKLNIHFGVINATLAGVETLAVLYLGSMQIFDNAMSIGMLMAFVAYKDNFIGKAFGLIEKGIEFKMLELHLSRLSDIALTEEEPNLDDQPLSTCVIDGAIESRNLSYRYGEGLPHIIKDLNITIHAGESVAIVGPSGCGKTTFLKLLLGLLTPTEGEILVDEKNISSVGLANYRRNIAAVTQDDQLLSGSIADNISFFDPNPDRDRIFECARLAAIDRSVEQMPMQYNTLIGDMGSSLSGGQKQRVLLARALYRQPKILILDEATSHLDSMTESVVNSAIKALNITRIIVAHRHETVRSADRVLELRGAKLIELTPPSKVAS
ncbi:peptidase domain-containing ABC transporter [Porticoccaceae bacterium LTM1]|nr:peptidase domain-containing ABC transporter [Porticoccaceae bacterium LTM1]